MRCRYNIDLTTQPLPALLMASNGVLIKDRRDPISGLKQLHVRAHTDGDCCSIRAENAVRLDWPWTGPVQDVGVSKVQCDSLDLEQDIVRLGK
jgi:hypothetical protein